MSGRPYTIEEYVDVSPEGHDAASRNGVERAARAGNQLRCFEVKETRGPMVDGAFAH